MKPNLEKEKLEDRVANIVYSLFKILVISINQPDELCLFLTSAYYQYDSFY